MFNKKVYTSLILTIVFIFAVGVAANANDGERYEFTLEAGKSYSLRNISDRDIKINMISIQVRGATKNKFNYVMYDEAGELKAAKYRADSFIGLEIPAGHTVKINVLEQDIVCWIPYEEKSKLSKEETSEIALHEFVLDAEKGYDFKNISDRDIKINMISIQVRGATKNKFNYVMYDEAGELKAAKYRADSFIGLEIPAGHTVKINVLEQDIVCWIPYEEKSKLSKEETSEIALHEFVLDAEKGYDFKNISDRDIKINMISIRVRGATKNKFNYVMYDEAGELKAAKYRADSLIGLEIPAGHTVKINVLEQDIVCWIPYEEKSKLSKEETSEIALHEFVLDAEKGYNFKNISDRDIKINMISIRVRGATKNKFNYVMYDEAGELKATKYRADSLIGLEIPSGYSVIVDILEKDIKCWIPYELYNSLQGIPGTEGLMPLETKQLPSQSNIIADPGYEVEQPIGTLSDDGNYIVNNFDSQEFVTKGEFAEFQDVYLNNNLLTKDVDYTAVEGSTKITIKSQTLQTKANNNSANTIKAEFKNQAGEIKQATQIFNLSVPITRDKLTVIYNGKTGAYDPIVKSGTSYIRARKLVEETLGGEIYWSGTTREITVIIGGETLIFTEKGSTYYFNGEEKTIQNNPGIFFHEQSTYVPVRFICEAFGMSVEYNKTTNIANIDN